jgi:hypothetical protein
MGPSNGKPEMPAAASPVRRLALAFSALAFFAWIGWLAYLAETASKPVVLSRPQFLLANLDVIADIEDLDGPVTVAEVYWPPAEKALEGKKLSVANLADLTERGWEGPGRYILPLLQEAGGKYLVAPIPPSPGFQARSAGKPRIYRYSPQTYGQLREIRKP